MYIGGVVLRAQMEKYTHAIICISVQLGTKKPTD